ncbi:O-antigen ligase family protein [Halobacteriovorax sp. RT-2-4]|uniref:O-antigen ligase family protein n=1 Tax=unclassified Halobacteriovorax TaxID=2639665 RepID=UPI00399ABEF1
MNLLIFFSIIFTTIGICFSPTLIGVADLLIFFSIILSVPLVVKHKIRLPIPNKFLILTFIIACISSMIVIPDIALALKAIKKARYFLFGALSYYPFYFFFSRKNDLKNLFKKYYLRFFVVCFGLSFAYGLYQVYQIEGSIFALLRGVRMAGSIHITKFAYISSFTASLAISFIFLLNLDKKNKIFSITLSVLSVVGVLTSKTRGALLSLLASLSVGIYFKSKKLAFIIFGFLAILVGTMIVISNTSYSDSVRMLTLKNDSTLHRIALYKSGVVIFKEKPWLGFGYRQSVNEVPRVAKEYKIENLFYPERIHHTFLEIAADIGIFGLLAFCGWFFSWGYVTLVSPSAFTKSTLALVVNAFVCAQFDVFNQTVMFAFILLAFNMSLVTDRLARNKLNE